MEQRDLVTILTQLSDDDAACVFQLNTVTEGTVRAWRSGERLPNGEVLIRLRGALNLLGYRLPEFDQLPEPARKLALMVTLSVVRAEDVMSRLGYANAHSLYRVLLEGTSLMANRAQVMQQIVADNEPRLQEMIERWNNQVVSPPAHVPPLVMASEPSPMVPTGLASVTQHLVLSLSTIARSTEDDPSFTADAARFIPRSDLKRALELLTSLATV